MHCVIRREGRVSQVLVNDKLAAARAAAAAGHEAGITACAQETGSCALAPDQWCHCTIVRAACQDRLYVFLPVQDAMGYRIPGQTASPISSCCRLPA